MTVFKYPSLLFLIIVPVILVIWRIYMDSRRKQSGVGYSNFALLKKVYRRSFRNYLSGLPLILKAVALTLVILAIARPQFGEGKDEIKRRGIDVFISLDVSGSMSAEDLKPDRMTAARELTADFIKKITDHRVGMVIFAGRALVLCPLTVDYGIISDQVNKIKVGDMPIDGTAIGDAIANCINKFKDEKSKSKVIILLTDGENNSGTIDPLAAAKIARDKGIKIYTIGIGSVEGAPIPVTRGGQKFYLRNNDGSLVIPKIDEKLLQEIAYMTDGRYFRATDEKKLKEIYEIINNLEKSDIVVSRMTLYSEQAHYLLFAAFITLVINFLIEYRLLLKI
ncbi:MAG: VWA domain-containing protein [Candidatus Wallbacteria bacterium]